MIQRLVLLPGMDGTGELFADFVKALPLEFETEIVRYPTDFSHSYPELMTFVRSAVPASEPFVLMTESYSTPLAIQFAATNPPYLKGLILCAGFASSPVRGWLRFLCSFLSLFLFRLKIPGFAAKLFLIGPNAAPSLLVAVQAAISSVHPKVLTARLRSVLNCDVRAELGRVTVPILYIQASRDRLVHASSMEEIQRIKSQIVVATIAGPHLILQREPQQAAEVVTRFVQGLLWRV
jgi:pimeloyl-ACP methyl ester carboxylesterase